MAAVSILAPRMTRAWLLLAAIGLGLVGYGLYIPLKAQLAQFLFARSWQQARQEGRPVQPWSWADHAAIAELTVPRLQIDQYVLDNATPRALAFGPGNLVGSARPDQSGTIVISGHRDTHLRWLQFVHANDRIILRPLQGPEREFVVSSISVYHRSARQLLQQTEQSQLRLITCYPFEGLNPATELRYVVTATEVAPTPARLQ